MTEPTVIFHIARRDEADNNPLIGGGPRKKHGDVVSVRAYRDRLTGQPVVMSEKQRAEYVAVPAFGITLADAETLVGGLYKEPMDTSMTSTQNRVLVRKNKFSMDVGLLKKGWNPNLDEVRFQQKGGYQPWKDTAPNAALDFSEQVKIVERMTDKTNGKWKYTKEKVWGE